MNTLVWIIQGILAVIFLLTGVMKLINPKEKIVEKTPYAEDLSQMQLYLIGILEILGVLGLILPGITGIFPILTPLAALGLAMTMVVAFLIHLRRGEVIPVGVLNLVLLALALFVAYERFFQIPLS